MNSELTLVGARQVKPWDERGSRITAYDDGFGPWDGRGSRITVYDDGFGPCWLYREAGGLTAVVRATSWETAYECCQDEIMDRVPPEEVCEAFGFYVMEYGGSFWLVPYEVELEHTSTRWESFNGRIPGRRVVGAYATREQAMAHCHSIIEQEELDLVEGYEWQPNATGTGIVSIDLNGTDLRPLTAELRSELGIVLEVTQPC